MTEQNSSGRPTGKIVSAAAIGAAAAAALTATTGNIIVGICGGAALAVGLGLVMVRRKPGQA